MSADTSREPPMNDDTKDDVNDDRIDDAAHAKRARTITARGPGRIRLRRTLVASATAGALVLGGLGIAHGVGRDGDRGARMIERVVERASDRLELDDAQGAALGALVTALAGIGETLRGDGARTEIESLVAGPTLDQGAALAMIESRADALRAAAPELVAAAAGFYDTLDEAQRAEVDELIDRAGRRGFGHRFGRGHD